MPDKIAP